MPRFHDREEERIEDRPEEGRKKGFRMRWTGSNSDCQDCIARMQNFPFLILPCGWLQSSCQSVNFKVLVWPGSGPQVLDRRQKLCQPASRTLPTLSYKPPAVPTDRSPYPCVPAVRGSIRAIPSTTMPPRYFSRSLDSRNMNCLFLAWLVTHSRLELTDSSSSARWQSDCTSRGSDLGTYLVTKRLRCGVNSHG